MGKSIISLIAYLLMIAFFGLGIWGSHAIGAALGYYGVIGFACGAGIIAAGVIGAVVVSVALYAVVKGVQSLCSRISDWFRNRREERAEQQRHLAQDNQNTRGINDRLYQGDQRRQQHAEQPAHVNVPAEYTQPPQYQGAPPGGASAPPDQYQYQPKQYR